MQQNQKKKMQLPSKGRKQRDGKRGKAFHEKGALEYKSGSSPSVSVEFINSSLSRRSSTTDCCWRNAFSTFAHLLSPAPAPCLPLQLLHESSGRRWMERTWDFGRNGRIWKWRLPWKRWFDLWTCNPWHEHRWKIIWREWLTVTLKTVIFSWSNSLGKFIALSPSYAWFRL